MVDLCPVVKSSGIQIMVWKLDWKSLFLVKGTDKSRNFIIWIPNTHIVQYSDESSIQVSGIQMVTVIEPYS